MAIFSTLIGGVFGFFTFVAALTFFDAGILTALGLYASVGIGLTTTLILAGLAWQSMAKLSSPRPVLLACPAPITAGNAAQKRSG